MKGRDAALAVAGIVTFLNLYAPQAVLPALAASFAVAPSRMGLAVTAPLLAVALVAPLAGLVSDRLGRKALILGACALLVVPTALIAGTHSLEAMLLWRFAQGALLPFIFPVAVAYIGDECPGAEGIRAASWYSTGSILGGFGGRAIAGLVTDLLGDWRMAFLVLAVLAAASAVLIAVLLPRERNFQPVRPEPALYRAHLRNPRLLSICAVGFGMLFANVATFTFVNFHLAAPPYSLTSAQLGLVFSVYLLGAVTTALSSRLTLRIGWRKTLAAALLLAGAGLLLTLAPVTALAIAGLAGLSGGLFVVQALCIGFIGAVVPRGKSAAVGLYVTLYYIGGALGGVLPGAVWHSAGWPGVVALILAMLAAMMAVAARHWTAPL